MPSPALPVVRERIQQQRHMCMARMFSMGVTIQMIVATRNLPGSTGTAFVCVVAAKENGLNTAFALYTIVFSLALDRRSV
jgi:hypothetical protein